MPEFDFGGLNETTQAAFKPYFADVVRRMSRRRRNTRIAGAALAVVAVATGTATFGLPRGGHSEVGTPAFTPSRTPDFIPAPEGTPSPGTEPKVRPGPMVAGDLDNVYLRWQDCRSTDGCAQMVAASGDGGGTWHSYPLPAGRDAIVDLRAVGPRVLVAWVQEQESPVAGPPQTWHASTDGGATWRDVSPRRVDTIPAGWQVLDDFDPLHGENAGITAIDPATGEVDSLPARTLRLAKAVPDLPIGAGLWISGYVGQTVHEAPDASKPDENAGRITGTGSAVEVSHDRGRTWQRYAFPEELIGSEDQSGGSAIATGDGRTVYAVGRVGEMLRVYRSLDGGRTWRRTAAEQQVGARPIRAAVGANGRLVIQAGPEQNRPVLMFDSVDGGASVRPIPPGPGASVRRIPGGYAQTGSAWASGIWLSADGTKWDFVSTPRLP